MNKIRIKEYTPKSTSYEINLPYSKSYSNRALILKEVFGDQYHIETLSNSTDTMTLIKNLEEIRMGIHELRTGDGGTTNRFLIAYLLRFDKKFVLYPDKEMLDRPWDEFERLSRVLNFKFLKKENTIEVQGPIEKINKVEIDCSKTSQVLSAFKLAFSDTDIEFTALNLKASQKYLALTDLMIKEHHCNSSPDSSSLGFIVAMSFLFKKISVTNYTNRDSYQADDVILDLYKKMNGCFDIDSCLKLSSMSSPKCFDVDLSTCLDLAPPLFFIASIAIGESHFKGFENLNFKESRRLDELLNIFKIYNVDHTLDNELLIIRGNPKKQTRKIDYQAPKDHRIIMTMALFMSYHAGGSIDNFKYVAKSFPDFFQLLDNQ